MLQEKRGENIIEDEDTGQALKDETKLAECDREDWPSLPKEVLLRLCEARRKLEDPPLDMNTDCAGLANFLEARLLSMLLLFVLQILTEHKVKNASGSSPCFQI